MALLKKSFKVYGKQDIQTKYLAFDGTNKLSVASDNGDLVLGKINPQKKCIPAGSLVKFDGTSHKVVSAVAGDVTDAKMNTSTYMLAEDLYPEDNGFVYWVVEDVNNLEAR